MKESYFRERGVERGRGRRRRRKRRRKRGEERRREEREGGGGGKKHFLMLASEKNVLHDFCLWNELAVSTKH
jgi:hypothetical protein